MPHPSLKTILRALVGLIRTGLIGIYIACIVLGLFMIWPPLAFIGGGIIGLMILSE